MAEISIVVCDVCGAMDRHITRYRIAKADAGTHFDLCAEHAQPIEDVIATKAAIPPAHAFADSGAQEDELAKRKNERAARRRL